MELGYALCRVGEDRIIYVMNTAYGDAEGIMFNLKHRRWPIKYALSRGSNRGERKLACENLATSLASAIKTTLSAEHSLVEETIRRLDRQSLDAILAAIPRGYFSVKNDGTFGSLVSNLPMYMSIGRLLDLNVIWAEYSLGGQQKRYSYKLTYLGKLVAKEIQGVVEFGTARRAFNSVKLSNGQVLAVGGKTGTGDNRFQTYGRHGWVTSSRVVNRTAAFVFTIGDRYFGTVVAYVPGSEAAGYSFTSALPVQVFKTLVPSIMPVIDPAPEQVTKAPLSTKL
jgi:hypothetical protein